jgi:serine/threonine protein kinase
VVASSELGGAGAIANGRYLLVGEIGSGGMGKVWEGRDTQLNRTVAIKELSLDLVPPAQHAEYLERAVQEGRNAAALADHPGIVTVYDVVVEAGSPWTIMQFVRGRSLAELLKSGPAPVETVATMAGQLLAAIRRAHHAGIVHRDVKPSNIMIDAEDGRALLTDFGIAKNIHDAGLTKTGTVIGSAPYMAPERHRGDSSNPASDLFSLGVTLFEAVEGYNPFATDSYTGTLTAILTSPTPLMHRAGRLTPLILALTEKDPRNRPTIEQALGMLNGAPISGPTPVTANYSPGMADTVTPVHSEMTQGLPNARTRKRRVLLIAGAVAVVLACAAGGTYGYAQGRYYVTPSSDGRQILLYQGMSSLSFTTSPVSMAGGPLWIESVPQSRREGLLHTTSFGSEDAALAYLEPYRTAAKLCTDYRHSQSLSSPPSTSAGQQSVDDPQAAYCSGTTDGP